MLKFRCQHCGQRIAVPARHLGKLVTCAECGRVTHPLAEQLVKAKQPAASAPATAAPSAASSCANCAKPFGKLQATSTWEAQRVCMPCYHALSADSSLAGATRTVPALVTRVAPPVVTPATLPVRERLTRTLVVFVVAVVALYGALTLLRDIAGLVATVAVAILALIALYAVFRSKLVGRPKGERGALIAP